MSRDLRYGVEFKLNVTMKTLIAVSVDSEQTQLRSKSKASSRNLWKLNVGYQINLVRVLREEIRNTLRHPLQIQRYAKIQ